MTLLKILVGLGIVLNSTQSVGQNFEFHYDRGDCILSDTKMKLYKDSLITFNLDYDFPVDSINIQVFNAHLISSNKREVSFIPDTVGQIEISAAIYSNGIKRNVVEHFDVVELPRLEISLKKRLLNGIQEVYLIDIRDSITKKSVKKNYSICFAEFEIINKKGKIIVSSFESDYIKMYLIRESVKIKEGYRLLITGIRIYDYNVSRSYWLTVSNCEVMV